MFNRRRFVRRLTLAGVVLVVLTFGAQVSAEAGDLKFEVTITNITEGQILSPAVVVSHQRSMPALFRVGEEASAELAAVAEDAVLDFLIDVLEAGPKVTDVAVITGVNGPILPGESASAVLDAVSTFHGDRISLVGMLVTTNDAFFGVNSVSPRVLHPFLRRDLTQTFYSPAYDAGSEANNEDCDFIPGPPCGNGGVRETSEAEGFVHIHSGIHGVGDLAVSEFDWRNPVAKITVRLFQGQ
jgi:hypothetical protein